MIIIHILRVLLTEERKYHLIAVVASFLFLFITYAGFQKQHSLNIFEEVIYNNMLLCAISIFFLMAIVQYFILKDKTFWFYSLYILCNISYFHYAVFIRGGNLDEQIKYLDEHLPQIAHALVGYSLIVGYYIYTKFSICFLGIHKKHSNFYERLKKYNFLYASLIVINTFIVILSLLELLCPKYFIFGTRIIILFCGIIGAVALVDSFYSLKGFVAKTFLLGSSFYFVGSILGFLCGTKLFLLSFNNHAVFTEIGVLLELMCFSTGLAYRMKLIEKKNIELEVDKNRLEIEKLQQENENKTSKIKIFEDLHDKVQGRLASIGVRVKTIQQQNTRIDTFLTDMQHLFQKYSEEFPNNAQTKFEHIAIQIKEVHNSNKEALKAIRDAEQTAFAEIQNLIKSDKTKTNTFENIYNGMRQDAKAMFGDQPINIDFKNLESNSKNLILTAQECEECKSVFSEALYNISKHANCTEINVQMQLTHNCVVMQIKDNGNGFDCTQISSGNGLNNMKRRANRLKGNCHIYSELGKGTTIKFQFPINTECFFLESLVEPT